MTGVAEYSLMISVRCSVDIHGTLLLLMVKVDRGMMGTTERQR
jgi:hypothetical protein